MCHELKRDIYTYTLQGFWALLLTHMKLRRECLQDAIHSQLLSLEFGYTCMLQVRVCVSVCLACQCVLRCVLQCKLQWLHMHGAGGCVCVVQCVWCSVCGAECVVQWLRLHVAGACVCVCCYVCFSVLQCVLQCMCVCVC